MTFTRKTVMPKATGLLTPRRLCRKLTNFSNKGEIAMAMDTLMGLWGKQIIMIGSLESERKTNFL